MSELDKKKIDYDDLKTWRNYAINSLLAIIAFIFTKWSENIWIFGLCILAILFLGIGVFVTQRKIFKIVKEIGEL